MTKIAGQVVLTGGQVNFHFQLIPGQVNIIDFDTLL